MRRELLPEDVEFAVKGGSIYGCGGGGFADHGRTLGNIATAVGRPQLVSVDELDPDALVATMAAIGAPGGLTDWEMRGVDYLRAVELLQEASERPVVGLMIGQNGMSSTLNAWLPGAVLGLAVVDAVGDLRAHPTGDMGSLGLANSPEPMIQTGAGGNRDRGAYLEVVLRGPTARVSPALRTAANEAGGFIASCRNPIPVRMVTERAVLGGITQALDVGRAIVRAEPKGGEAVIEAICETTAGAIIAAGTVVSTQLAYTKEAFDCGRIEVRTSNGRIVAHVLNEYMALERDGARIATYPDVITTLTPEGVPVSAARLREGTPVRILHVPKERLALSASVLDPSVYPPVERALGIDIARYALEGVERSGVRT
ncbi:MAG TPA: DUF917 family protein [Steroidobacteraceae bacterium]|nr:DUF917 family protein [Steroidobacteraceae bacterium]